MRSRYGLAIFGRGCGLLQLLFGASLSPDFLVALLPDQCRASEMIPALFVTSAAPLGQRS